MGGRAASREPPVVYGSVRSPELPGIDGEAQQHGHFRVATFRNQHFRHALRCRVERIRPSIPMQRIGQPDEVAGVVSFLMSPDAAYVTRQVIAVNGGLC